MLLMTFAFQFFNLILVIVLLMVPVIITILLLKYFNRKNTDLQSEEFLIQKIRDLEERIQELENKY